MTQLNNTEHEQFYSIDAIYQRYIKRFGDPQDHSEEIEVKDDKNQIKNSLENKRKAEIFQKNRNLLTKAIAKKSKPRERPEKYESIFSMTEKKECGCKFPISGSGIGIIYCEEIRKSGSQFCEEHHSICRPFKKSFAIPSDRVLYQGIENSSQKEEKTTHIAIDIEIRNNRNITDHYNHFD